MIFIRRLTTRTEYARQRYHLYFRPCRHHDRGRFRHDYLHRLKQPVVLGYIVAGILIGPHTPPFELIRDEHTIKVLAELGVIFLMFSLGLEFSIRKLLKVGATALIAAVLEIVVMIWLGYQIGLWLGWNNNLDALFLGAILAISSTTIIVKALNDLKMKHERFAQLIFGVLIVEDILALA